MYRKRSRIQGCINLACVVSILRLCIAPPSRTRPLQYRHHIIRQHNALNDEHIATQLLYCNHSCGVNAQLMSILTKVCLMPGLARSVGRFRIVTLALPGLSRWCCYLGSLNWRWLSLELSLLRMKCVVSSRRNALVWHFSVSDDKDQLTNDAQRSNASCVFKRWQLTSRTTMLPICHGMLRTLLLALPISNRRQLASKLLLMCNMP